MELPNLQQIDGAIRELVMALNAAGIQTDWSCSGEEGHMLIRPTIQARTIGDLHSLEGVEVLNSERQRIEAVMLNFSISNYWLLLNQGHGAYNTHGDEPTWILMLPGRFDLTTALPAAYSALFQTDDDLDPCYE